jgi:hypothetical protein
MGYESALVAVYDNGSLPVDGYSYSEVLGVFRVGKFPVLSKFFQEKKFTSLFFFDPFDGDKKVLADEYGDGLKEASVGQRLEFLNGLPSDDTDDLMIKAVLAFLSALPSEVSEDVKILHYGY